MLASEILTRVKNVFGDTAAVQIDDVMMLDWVNDGQTDICRKAECLESVYSTNIVVGTDAYGYPPDFIKEQRVTVNGYKVKRTTKQGLDVLYADRAVSPVNGTALFYFHYNRKFNLYPKPDVAITNGLVVWYIRNAAVLTAVGQTPEIPAIFHEDLVKFCMVKAYELDEQWSAADRKKQDYEAALMQTIYDSQNLQAESYPSVACLPGDY